MAALQVPFDGPDIPELDDAVQSGEYDIELISKCVPMVMQFRAAQFLGLNKSVDEDNHNASEIKDNHDVNYFARAI